MFQRVSHYLWPNAARDNASNSTTANLSSHSFAERLKAIHYDESNVPDYFHCPITLSIMENPVIVNNHQSHTFENDELKKWLSTQEDAQEKIDFFRTEINMIDGELDIKPNVERQHQIEMFVSTLEQIHELQQTLTGHESIQIQSMDNVVQDLDLTPEQSEQLLLEQREEQTHLILQTKLMLALEIQTFISLTETAIHAEDKREIEKTREIERITAQKRADLLLLKKQLAPTYPDIFPDFSGDPHLQLQRSKSQLVIRLGHRYHEPPNNQRGNAVRFENPFMFSSFSVLLRQLSLIPTHRVPSWQQSLFHIPPNPHYYVAMILAVYMHQQTLNNQPALDNNEPDKTHEFKPNPFRE